MSDNSEDIIESSDESRAERAARRPKEIDGKIMGYLPGLRKAASRYYPKEPDKATDLVTDTIAHCLDNWQNYREGGGFFTWMLWAMRSQHGNAKKTKARRIWIIDPPKSDSDIKNHYKENELEDVFDKLSGGAPANQEEYVALRQVVDFLSRESYGSDILKVAMGYSNEEIAAETGISRQGVQQRSAAVRRRMEKLS